MKWRLAIPLTLLTILCLGGALARPGFPDKPSGGVLGTPLRDVAAPLRDLWLHFHENDFCLGLDTIFVFQPKGVEIWCRIKEEKSFQGFNGLIAPLQRSFRIDLYATHPSREKKPYSLADDDPLPSIWNNAELRAYLGDASILHFRPQDPASAQDPGLSSTAPDPALKRRMKLYGDDVLDLTARMERLASDLPPLAGAAYGPDIMPDIRARARAVCLEHARETGKCAGRLADNLSHALPRGSGTASAAPPPEKAQGAPVSPYDAALALSAQAQALGQRIKNFLYPQAHTVDLAELRDRGLIDSLKALQKTVSEFQGRAQNAR